MTYGKREDTRDDLVGDFDDDVGNEECLPAVGFAGSLADLVERALADEKRHDLVNQRGEDCGDHEDGEEHVLHALLRSVGIVERESNEQTSRNAEHELSENVRGHTPVLAKGTLGDFGQLLGEGHGEFRVSVLVGFFMFLGVRLFIGDLINTLLDLLGFFAALPSLKPVVVFLSGNLKHVLSWVLVVATFACAIAGEVLQEGFRVVSDVTKVDGLAALSQEEESVELLEQNGRRLVNSTQDGLSVVRKLAQESADCPGRLGIQTTGRFVEEQE